jgi:methionine sulfoxide reductase heme-binding subunit
MPRRRAPAPAIALRATAHVAGLLPLVLLVADARLRHLTADPIQEITLRTGKFALVFLVASLVVTPLVSAFGLHRLIPVRRTLGLYCFAYALLHFLTFAWLDYDFDLGLIGAETAEKRYVLVGFAAFCLLATLAATSTRGWQRRLGKRWKPLHRWVYVAAPLVIAHFVWLVKADRREPLAWGGVVVALLAARHPQIRRRLAARRARG